MPSALTLFQRDLVVPAPKQWVERVFNVQHYHVAPEGGHFPALEKPELIISELRRFFASYR